MRIQNNTPVEVSYGVSSPGTGDCGTINPGREKEVGYNQTSDVTVTVVSLAPSNAFQLNIPQTGTQNSVTIGIFFN